jgi:hypothetical protein
MVVFSDILIGQIEGYGLAYTPEWRHLTQLSQMSKYWRHEIFLLRDIIEDHL